MKNNNKKIYDESCEVMMNYLEYRYANDTRLEAQAIAESQDQINNDHWVHSAINEELT